MTKTEAKKIAQEVIMGNGPDQAREFGMSLARDYAPAELTTTEQEMILNQIEIQAQRIYKLFRGEKES
jgi:hypothetical protein